MKLRISIIILLFFLPKTNAQDIDARSSFIYTGITMNIPKKHKLTIYSGISPTDNVYMLRVLPAFKVNQYLTLTPGFTYYDLYDDEKFLDKVEYHIMPMATLTFPISKNKKWSITDRNMFFYKIRSYSTNVPFYRNRLGVTYKTSILKQPVSFFVYDEIYFNFDSKNISRNQATIGAQLNLKWLTPQIMYTHQTEQGKKNKGIYSLSLLIPLENFGFFNSK